MCSQLLAAADEKVVQDPVFAFSLLSSVFATDLLALHSRASFLITNFSPSPQNTLTLDGPVI